MKIVPGMILQNVSNSVFADRASGLSLAPGARATVTLDACDPEFLCAGDVFEGLSCAVGCGILTIIN